MNNKLAEALGIKFCKTCGEEITNVEYAAPLWTYIMHDTQGFYYVQEAPNEWNDNGKFNHEARKRD